MVTLCKRIRHIQHTMENMRTGWTMCSWIREIRLLICIVQHLEAKTVSLTLPPLPNMFYFVSIALAMRYIRANYSERMGLKMGLITLLHIHVEFTLSKHEWLVNWKITNLFSINTRWVKTESLFLILMPQGQKVQFMWFPK